MYIILKCSDSSFKAPSCNNNFISPSSALSPCKTQQHLPTKTPSNYHANNETQNGKPEKVSNGKHKDEMLPVFKISKNGFTNESNTKEIIRNMNYGNTLCEENKKKCDKQQNLEEHSKDSQGKFNDNSRFNFKNTIKPITNAPSHGKYNTMSIYEKSTSKIFMDNNKINTYLDSKDKKSIFNNINRTLNFNLFTNKFSTTSSKNFEVVF